MEVRSVVRAECCPRKRETGDCRREAENLWRSGSRDCWSVDEMFATDSRGNDEDKENGNPSTFFVPAGGQERVEVVILDDNDNAYQLRTLRPQKDTCQARR